MYFERDRCTHCGKKIDNVPGWLQPEYDTHFCTYECAQAAYSIFLPRVEYERFEDTERYAVWAAYKHDLVDPLTERRRLHADWLRAVDAEKEQYQREAERKYGESYKLALEARQKWDKYCTWSDDMRKRMEAFDRELERNRQKREEDAQEERDRIDRLSKL